MTGLYADPKRQAEYARYMSKKAPNDTSKKEREYWTTRANSLEGHDEATKKATEELNRRLALRDKRR